MFLVFAAASATCDFQTEVTNVASYASYKMEKGQNLCVHSQIPRSVVGLGNTPSGYTVIVHESDRQAWTMSDKSIFVGIEAPTSFEITAREGGTLTLSTIGLGNRCYGGITVTNDVASSEFSSGRLPFSLADEKCYFFVGFPDITAELEVVLDSTDSVNCLCETNMTDVPMPATAFSVSCRDGGPPLVIIGTSTVEVSREVKFRAASGATDSAVYPELVSAFMTPWPNPATVDSSLVIGIIFGCTTGFIVMVVIVVLISLLIYEWIQLHKRTVRAAELVNEETKEGDVVEFDAVS